MSTGSSAIPDRKPPAITLRGVVVGALTAAATLYGTVVAGQGIGAGRFVNSQLPMTAIVPFVLWLFVNTALKRVWPRAALSRGELLTILTMTWVVGVLPQRGWVSFWTAIVTAPVVLATPENRWADLLFDYLPWHVFAPTSPQVLEAYWFGLPEGMPLPWSAWGGVTARWLAVSMATVVFGYCLLILFQKQWEDREKLTFPLAQFPLDLTRGFDGGRRMPDLFFSRAFWAGFCLVFPVLLYNVVTYFVPGLPTVGIWTERYPVQLGEDFPNLTFRVLPIVLAVTYLCPVNILGSLIFFHLLYVLKEGAIRTLGLSVTGFSGVGATGQVPEFRQITDMESYGALIFVAVWSIWLARRHLWEVSRLVWTGNGARGEVIRYRLALAGLVLSGLYVVGWGIGLGMSPPLALLAFTTMALTYFVIVKLIAATGFAYLFANETHAKGQSFIVELVGTDQFDDRQVVGFKVFSSRAFLGDIRIPAWPAITHHLRIFSLSRQPIWVTTAVLIAFPLGFLVTAGAAIDLAYREGGSGHLGTFLLTDLAHLIRNPSAATPGKWTVFLGGWFEAAAIAILRARFHWFPLHPLGLAFQSTIGIRVYWFSLFLVWTVKLILLGYGGVRAYLSGKPFFYGMAVGYVVGVTLSLVVDLVWFPVQGHRMHAW